MILQEFQLLKDLMSDFMKKSYIKSLDIADAVLIILDISKKGTKNESSIIKICEENNIPVSEIKLICTKIIKF